MRAEKLATGIRDMMVVIEAVRDRIIVNLHHASKEGHNHLIIFRNFLNLMIDYLSDLLEHELKE